MIFSSDFPSGNGKLIRSVRRDWGWEIEFLAESKADEPQPLWFYFRLAGLDGEKVRMRLANSGQCLGDVNGWGHNRPVVRFDSAEWRRVERVESQWNDAQVLETVFETDVTGPDMECAFCYPYPDAQLTACLAERAGFSETVIGWSGQGRPIRRISNTFGSAARDLPGVYVTGRLHASEVTGAWMIDGMLRYLASPEGRAARERCVWWFVPMADIDGVEEGFYGKDQIQGDLNRAFHPHFPKRAEIHAVQRDIARWNQCAAGRLLLDMHSPGHAERTSYFVVDAQTPDAFRSELRTVYERFGGKLAEHNLRDLWFKEKKPGDNTSAQSGMTSAQYAHALGVNGAVFECSYQGDSGKEYTVSDYRRMGAGLAEAVSETLRRNR